MADDPRSQAFEALALRVHEPLQRYLHRRCDADAVDDVLNDVLLTIWRRLDDVPPDAEMPWCYGVARRSLANHLRGRERRLRLVRRAEALAVQPRPEWTEAGDVALHEALASLPDVDREIVRLWAWERLEPREIAEVVDSTANAVSVRLHRIRTRLESEITRKNAAAAGQRLSQSNPELER